MKKTLTFLANTAVLLFICIFNQPAYPQEMSTANNLIQITGADVAPGQSSYIVPFKYDSKNLWDILFNYNITANANGAGWAGVGYVNGEIWVSRWASDTLARLTPQGNLISRFVIAGLTGVRSFTTDGTYLYAGTASTTIYRINPVTRVLAPPHITVAATARFVTYDATLNSGSGGFWYGNFNTDITAVSMTGAVLYNIPAATHTLGGMYGAAVDNISAGGPYLWVFAQMAPNDCQITALALPSGTPTIYTHDAMSDVGVQMSLSSGLAGGVFLSNTISPGNVALIGLIQGTPNNCVFAYDVDILASFADLEVSDIRSTGGYSRIPFRQVSGETYTFKVRNAGTLLIDTVYADVEYRINGSPVFSETVTTTNLASAATFTFTTSPFLPANGLGKYTAFVTTHPSASITDNDASNDTIGFDFLVTDSVFARDNNVPDGSTGYAVSSTDWAYATCNYTLKVADTLKGVWVQIATPNNGDTTYAVLAGTAAGVPNTVLALGSIQIIDSSQHEYFLPFTSPVPLVAGTYAFGCYEGRSTTINLAQSTAIFTPGVNYFLTGSGSWTPSGIQTARFIRPVFEADPTVGIREHNNEIGFAVYPNPSHGTFMLELPENLLESRVCIYESSGREIKSYITKGKGRLVTIDLSTFPKGMYYLRIENSDITATQKIILL